MGKKLKEKLRHLTLIKKCFFAICGVTLVLLIAVNCLMPELLYHFLNPRMKQDLSVLTESVSTRTSYLLHQNCQYLLRFFRDSDFKEEVVVLAEKGENRKLQELLKEEKLGKKEPGSIKSTRNAVLMADWDSKLSACREGMEDYKEVLFQSEWCKNLKEKMKEIEEEYPGELIRCYSPVFEKTEKTEEFISLVIKKELEGHEVLLFLIEPFSDFRAVFSDFREDGIRDYTLIGYKDEILFKNKSQSVIEKIPLSDRKKLFSENQNTVKILEADRGVIIGIRSSYKIEQLKIAAALSKKNFLQPYQNWIHCFSFILISFAVLLLFLIVLILRRSFYKLELLAGQMKNIRDYEHPILPKIQSQDEVGILADTFYKMMDKLKNQEETKKQIEYSLMVSQIDPHFIYNTLYTITYLAELNQTDDIMILNRALIGMLKDRLKSSGLQAFDTLKKEKQQMENYITIQRYLCSNELTMFFTVEEGCEDLLYPKNMLQPLMENSIKHGILLNRDKNGKLIPGEIHIHIRRSGKRIETEVWDNGTGMDSEKIQEYFYEEPRNNPDGEHIGIYNIRIRMAYLFGNQYELFAKGIETGGLYINFSFPERLS